MARGHTQSSMLMRNIAFVVVAVLAFAARAEAPTAAVAWLDAPVTVPTRVLFASCVESRLEIVWNFGSNKVKVGDSKVAPDGRVLVRAMAIHNPNLDLAKIGDDTWAMVAFCAEKTGNLAKRAGTALDPASLVTFELINTTGKPPVVYELQGKTLVRR